MKKDITISGKIFIKVGNKKAREFEMHTINKRFLATLKQLMD